MRDFKFTESDRPTMANFNARFDAIAALANGLGNEYVWEKTKSVIEIVYDLEEFKQWVSSSSSMSQEFTWYYADEIGEKLTLVNPQTVSVSYNVSTNANKLIGKFIYLSSNPSVVYKVPADATVSSARENGVYNVYLSKVINVKSSYSVISKFGYVNSPDPNAYPPAVSDGYTYTYLGQIGEKVRIETGSYTGTGTYGSSNPNRLTFGFRPRFLAISTLGLYSSAELGKLNAGSQKIELWYMEHTWGRSNFGLGTADKAKWIDDKTIEWYTTSTSGNPALKQYNYQYGYIYIAIG